MAVMLMVKKKPPNHKQNDGSQLWTQHSQQQISLS